MVVLLCHSTSLLVEGKILQELRWEFSLVLLFSERIKTHIGSVGDGGRGRHGCGCGWVEIEKEGV